MARQEQSQQMDSSDVTRNTTKECHDLNVCALL